MREAQARIDRRLARRRFERAARSYVQASRIEAEVGARMLARLDYVRVAPQRILDAGAGPARETGSLAGRYGGAPVIALDYSLAMLRAARRGTGLLAALSLCARPHALCADLERLPLAAASFGLIWSNMALHWLDDPLAALREFHRVLVPGGLLMFSMLGPDSLKELRQAAGRERVHEFSDMHDTGDRLIEAGFAAPVMDMEMLRLRYSDPERLIDDLRRSGQTNARSDGRRGLGNKGYHSQLVAALRAGQSGGAFYATYEIVYGHAWKEANHGSHESAGLAPLRFLPRAGR